MRIDKAIAEAQFFSKLCEIIEKPKVRLTFWGGRYFSVEGYEGEFAIDDLAMRISKMVEKNFEFSEEQRPYGKQISGKIETLYGDLDRLIKKSCWLTRLFATFWRWHSVMPYGFPGEAWGRWCWMGKDRYFFDCYTRPQFQRVFGCSPEDAKRKRGFSLSKIHVGMHLNYPERWEINKKPDYTMRNQVYSFFQNQMEKIYPSSSEREVGPLGSSKLKWISDEEE